MDYYNILGLKRGATDADIKKAYRSLAMKHHPDRGGDEKTFKEVSTAYDMLTNPEKKRMIDAGVDPNAMHNQQGFGGNPFEFHFGAGDFNDVFNQFGFNFGQRPMRKNKSLNINVDLTLEDVLTGRDLNAEVSVPGGKKRMVNISIPPGIENNQQIKYSGMGDDSIPDLRPGDLIVNIFVRPHHLFRREGDSLIHEKEISVWDAMLGAAMNLETLDGRSISINIPPGTQPDTVLSCRGEGLPNIRNKIRGNLLIKIKIAIPKNLSHEQIDTISQIKNNFNR
jgi:curved DNA-binding protein